MINKGIYLICAISILAVFTTSVRAEEWGQVGLVTTKIKCNPGKRQDKSDDQAKRVEQESCGIATHIVQEKGFSSSDACWASLKHVSSSEEFIGEGGTDANVPRVDWNYDYTCYLINK